MRRKHPLAFWVTIGIATTVAGFFAAVWGCIAGRE